MIKEFNPLRAILIIFIFLHHRGVWEGAGGMAVACFFVLGGFCSALGYVDKVRRPDFHYGQYLVGRLVKYYPLHWLYLSISLLVGGGLFIKGLIANAVLLQSWVPIMNVYFSYNAVSWYLSDVVFFVWICPFLLRFFSSRSTRQVVVALLLLMVSYVIGTLFVPTHWRHALLYINPLSRMFDFSVGLVSGLLYLRWRDGISLSKAATLLVGGGTLGCLIVLSLFIPESMRAIPYIYWPFSMMLLGTLAFGAGKVSWLSHPILQKMGECSFSFYMAHLLCIQIFGVLLERMGVSVHWVATCLLLLITMGVAWISRNYFEIPVTRWLKSQTNQLFTTARL
ncbi:MAG: acyltransferase [Bacteroidales bacterium]|nr:acyltransferase [Bacteroidales bacterium]